MKTPLALIISTTLLATTAHAETTAPRINPKNVISVITNDWNNDGLTDSAILVAPDNRDNDIGLYLHLRNPDTQQLTFAQFKPNLVWSGYSIGQIPRLESKPGGSIAIHSMNESIGRNRWTQTLTIAYRNNNFIVAGYTYNAYDTLDPTNAIECDLNLLTGKGIKNGKQIAFTHPTTTLANWTEQTTPTICQNQ